MKKIIITWDLDGFVGALNSTLPYNYNFDFHQLELDCVRRSLQLLEAHNVKTTFATTGFSAEQGRAPYVFPDLIREIAQRGHEVASHSWRHEWVPLFSRKQVERSLLRSKHALEAAVGNNVQLTGFVPPHNKPATWVARGAYSLEDKGLYPLFEMGDMAQLLASLRKTDYKWVRIAYNPFINRLKKKEFTRRQRVYNHKNTLILENHYTGFDPKIVDYIEQKDQEYFIISAHPVMLNFKDGRPESWEHFEAFIKHFSKRDDIAFVRPMDVLDKFGIK